MQVDKVIKIVVGVAVGWLVEQAASDLLRQAGVPPHTAKVVGGIAGAVV